MMLRFAVAGFGSLASVFWAIEPNTATIADIGALEPDETPSAPLSAAGVNVYVAVWVVILDP